MQIDNQHLTVFSSLTDQTKLSTLSFLVGQDDAPFVQFAAGNTDAAIRVTNLAVPTAASDATNKEYVDSVVRGLVVKSPVRLMASTNVAQSASPPQAGSIPLDLTPGSVLDGKTLLLNDRVLLTGQTDQIENGIYIITSTGAVRSADLPNGSSATGVYVFVDEGTAFMDRSYVCTTDRVDINGNLSAVVGTNGTQWVQFSARPAALAGNGLVLGTANELDVNVDGSTIEVVADVVKVKNPNIMVKVERGLLRSSTNGTTATTATVDNDDPTVLGATVALGSNVTVQPDFTVLPDLQNNNTFTAKNTYNSTIDASWTVDGGGAVTLDGAVIVEGGVAVRKSVVALQAQLKSATDATSTTTGALVVDGGVGIAKTLRCGGDAYTAALHASSTEAATWAATGAITGALTVDGAAVVRNALHTGSIAIHETTDSTSTTTGAVTISGGLGVEKNVTCPTAHLVGTTTSTSSTTGALTVAGGVGIQENLNVGNDCTVTGALTANTGHLLATTASSSTTTGALVVDGGAGVAGAVYIGGVEHVAGSVFADNTDNATWQAVGALAGAVQVEGGVAVRKDVQCANVIANATTAATSSTTGALVVNGGAGIAENVYVGNDLNVTNVAYCKGTTDATWHATNALTGALQVEGGVSIRKDLHCLHGVANSTDNATWDASAALTGAIITEGGVSIRKDLRCLNAVVHANTAATSQTSGALVVNGGLGVGGSIFCTNSYNMSDERLKRNPEVITDALDRVCAMNGYTFEWNERMPGLENTKAVGVIAQEIEAQAPLCVLHNAETDLLAVEYSKLVPYLIESVKALKRKCDQLASSLGTAAQSSESSAPRAKRSKKTKH
jgi:hypothetical protein